MDDEQDRESARLEYESREKESSDRLRSQMEFANGLIRGLTLANGGAIIALFTFIGNSHAPTRSAAIWWAFLCFIAGLGLTLATALLAYLSQGNNLQAVYRESLNARAAMFGKPREYDSDSFIDRGSTFEKIAIITSILALLCFVIGASAALHAGLIS